jgi:hypothetical protein
MMTEELKEAIESLEAVIEARVRTRLKFALINTAAQLRGRADMDENSEALNIAADALDDVVRDMGNPP